MALDLTSFDAAMKEYYTEEEVANQVYTDNPLLALIPKDENFVGDVMPIPVIYGGNNGRSGTFSTAVTNKSNLKAAKFLLTRVNDYGLADIDRETILASKGNEGAFLDARTAEINMTIQVVTNSLCRNMYRDGSGYLGQVNNSSYATTNLDLVNDDDVVNFEVGDILVTSGTQSGGSVRSGTLTVSTVNRLATSNQIVTTANLNDATDGISAIAQNDYIYIQGDYDDMVTGFEGWLPTTAPASGDSFFGLDRSPDAVRLGGSRQDISSLPLVEGIIKAANLLGREGGRPEYMFVNHTQFTNIENALGGQVIRDVVKTKDGLFGFDSLVLRYAGGTLKVIADRNCQPNRGWMITMKTWKLASLGKCPHIFKDEDGLMVMRNTTADSYEVRTGYYAQMACYAPGYNMNLTLPS